MRLENSFTQHAEDIHSPWQPMLPTAQRDLQLFQGYYLRGYLIQYDLGPVWCGVRYVQQKRRLVLAVLANKSRS